MESLQRYFYTKDNFYSENEQLDLKSSLNLATFPIMEHHARRVIKKEDFAAGTNIIGGNARQK